MKNALITAANRGIGLELARQLIRNGYRVYALCRHSSSDLETTNAVVLKNVDVTRLDSIRAAKQDVDVVSLDLIVNVAGVLSDESIMDFGSQAVDQVLNQFDVNAVGPLRVISVFLEMLGPGSKVILITSRMGSISENDTGGRYGYRMSKAALNAAAQSLAIDLKEREIAVGLFHPGWVQTDMTNQTGNLLPGEAAELLMERINQLSLETSGQFVHAANGEIISW